MSCGVDCRHGLDPELLWLCSRLAAVALIQPLAWELPYATGVALKKQKTKTTTTTKKNKRHQPDMIFNTPGLGYFFFFFFFFFFAWDVSLKLNVLLRLTVVLATCLP